MVYCRKEFLKKEVEREHGSAITTTHEGRRHHTRTLAACAKGASWQTETSADHLAGEPGPGDPRDRHAAQRERAGGAQPDPPDPSPPSPRAGRGPALLEARSPHPRARPRYHPSPPL